MTRPLSARMIRIVIVTMLFASMVAAPSLAAPVPQPRVNAASQQAESTGSDLPGFGELPEDATLISSTSGEITEAVEAPVTLTVERLSVEAGESLEPVDGPQIIQVEQGLLTYEDDLGLEAEINAGGAQFFAAGEVGAISNTGEESAILVRTTLAEGAGSDNSDDQGAEGDDSETRDRDDRSDAEAGGTPGVHALFAQTTSTSAPDEVVITLTEDGFDPDQFEIVQGGDLVIENATEDACVFEIPDLQIETEIGAGDIESVTVDGSAGTHEFICTNDNDDVVGEGAFFLAIPEATPEATETPEPAASPEVDESATPAASPEVDESATPAATPEVTEAATEPVTTGEMPMGVLLEATIDPVPEGDQVLFAGQIVLDPDASLDVSSDGGAIGIAVTGGDLTVTRPGNSPAKLRDGRSVLLPDNTTATLGNTGEGPITLQIAGLVGVDASAGATPTEDAGNDSNGDSGSDNNAAPDTTGADQFFPADAEMEQLGLTALGSGPDEITNATDNAFWFDDEQQAEDLLPTFDWQAAVGSAYDSNGDETVYGVVDFFLLTVDVFGDESGGEQFFAFIRDQALGGQGRTSSDVEGLDGVSEHIFATGFDAEQKLDIGYLIIRSDQYVITIITAGTDLEPRALMEDVATLIFGPRG